MNPVRAFGQTPLPLGCLPYTRSIITNAEHCDRANLCKGVWPNAPIAEMLALKRKKTGWIALTLLQIP